jgi:cation:H+ antiporter
VIILGRAEVGISSIVGSALYNVLVIPAAAGLMAPSAMTINKEVVWRDNLYYLGVVVFLLVALALPYFSVTVENPEPNTQYWGMMVALLFIALYVIYVFLLHHSYKASLKNNQDSDVQESDEDDGEEKELEISSEPQAWGWIIGMMLLMGGASHVLVEAAIHLGDLAGIDAVIMGFVVIAAGTSVPDTVLSVISAKKRTIRCSHFKCVWKQHF